MSLLPRVRLALARRPWLYWLCVAVCAAVVWFSVAAAQERVSAARDSWGTTRTVWVTTGEVAAGEAVVAARGSTRWPWCRRRRSRRCRPMPSQHAASPPAKCWWPTTSPANRSLLPVGWCSPCRPTPRPSWRCSIAWSCSAAANGGATASWSRHRLPTRRQTEVVEVAVPPRCAADVSAQLALGAITLARLP